MGWDDNGLPTERRVQNYYGVRCDPSLPYDPSFVPPEKPAKQPISVSRPNFIELCDRLTAEDEKAFEHLWKTLGLSVDWSMTYATIGKRAQRVSQLAFLRLLERGLAYQVEAPTLWDVDFKTAVAQAELEDREHAGRVSPHRASRRRGAGRRVVEIETTRPELIPACVALVAHPDDERYQPLFGTEVVTPLFGVRVPVRAHALADPEKGSGIAMICTFGDITDVTWWRELSLPVRAVIQPDGTLRAGRRGARRDGSRWTPARAQRHYDELAGLSAAKARAKIVEQLRESATSIGEPRPITHAVKFYEKGDRPLEIVTSRQWFIKTIEFREALLARGRELQWHPAVHAGAVRELGQRPERRLVHQPPAVLRRAVSGLVSARRRRHASTTTGRSPPRRIGCRSIRRPTCRDGYRADQRGVPGGFAGDPDVMDTWATSSLTPQIVVRLARRSGSVRADVPDGPASAGARHHPHVAVRHGAARAPRARLAAVDATRRSPAGCSIPIARRCRSRRATSSRRWRCSRSTGRTACATGRRAGGRAPTRRSTRAR